MFQLGERFLTEYYRCFLRERGSVILCAENRTGTIVGLVSGSLAMEEHLRALRRRAPRLALASLPAIARSPGLARRAWSRRGTDSEDPGHDTYIATSGPREEYWAWDARERGGGGALALHLAWLNVMKALGARSVSLEVDRVNAAVLQAHRAMGASITAEWDTPDGRRRVAMQYVLD